MKLKKLIVTTLKNNLCRVESFFVIKDKQGRRPGSELAGGVSLRDEGCIILSLLINKPQRGESKNCRPVGAGMFGMNRCPEVITSG